VAEVTARADIGIPCYGCVTVAPPDSDVWFPVGAHDGFSCHPSPSHALVGAILESLQKRLTYISGSRDDLSRAELARVHDPELVTAVWDEINSEDQRHPFRQAPLTGPSQTDAFSAVAEAVHNSAPSRQIVFVDLTREEMQVPVVKCVVTGMRGPFGATADAA
jgi:ribosomal protein S12 methylthiotransferase accessory factor YcaO